MERALALVLFGIADCLVLTLDDEDVERFRSSYEGFLEAAHADESLDPELLEMADNMTEMFDFSLKLSLDDPDGQARRRNLREELQASWREELLEGQ